jgi:hypothetical protein
MKMTTKKIIFLAALACCWLTLILVFLPFKNIYFEASFISISLYLLGLFLEKERHPLYISFSSIMYNKIVFSLGMFTLFLSLLICHLKSYDFDGLSSDVNIYKLVRYFPSIAYSCFGLSLLIFVGRLLGTKPENNNHN